MSSHIPETYPNDLRGRAVAHCEILEILIHADDAETVVLCVAPDIGVLCRTEAELAHMESLNAVLVEKRSERLGQLVVHEELQATRSTT